VRAASLHGGGVRGDRAVPVLHELRRSLGGGGSPARAAAGIRQVPVERRDPGPRGPRDLRAVPARSDVPGASPSRPWLGLAPRSLPAPREPSGPRPARSRAHPRPPEWPGRGPPPVVARGGSGLRDPVLRRRREPGRAPAPARRLALGPRQRGARVRRGGGKRGPGRPRRDRRKALAPGLPGALLRQRDRPVLAAWPGGPTPVRLT